MVEGPWLEPSEMVKGAGDGLLMTSVYIRWTVPVLVVMLTVSDPSVAEVGVPDSTPLLNAIPAGTPDALHVHAPVQFGAVKTCCG